MRGTVFLLLVVVALPGFAGCGGAASCPSCDACLADGGCDSCDVRPDGTGVADAPPEVSGDAPAEVDPGAPSPTYWTAEATKTIDDLVFVSYNGQKVFGLGIHPALGGGWDGLTGANGCSHAQGSDHWVGTTNDGVQQTHAAADSGANFAYTWDYPRVEDSSLAPEYLHIDPPLLGIWHTEYGTLDELYGPGHEVVPVMACPYGETDMDGYQAANAQKMKDDFEDFKARRGKWSKETLPNLPSFADMPWFCWHPTFRMRGGGDGTGEVFTDEQVEAYAKSTNMVIGDSYSYVCNRWDGIDAVLQGQKGPMGECYDDWLSRNDPEHRDYFEAGWSLAHSLRMHANPDAVVWMWMQGHAFDDDIGGSTCWNGSSGLWARGPFPTLRYLRKEIMSTVAAGGTGFIYFGYGYGRDATSSRARSLIAALHWDEVYRPALLSPRLDVGQDLAFAGEGGRAHLVAKWDAESQTAYLLGANPGALVTPFEVTFPWTVAKVELLDWWTPGWIEDPAVHGIRISDRTVGWTAPQDDGFILRVTPMFAGGAANEGVR